MLGIKINPLWPLRLHILLNLLPRKVLVGWIPVLDPSAADFRWERGPPLSVTRALQG